MTRVVFKSVNSSRNFRHRFYGTRGTTRCPASHCLSLHRLNTNFPVLCGLWRSGSVTSVAVCASRWGYVIRRVPIAEMGRFIHSTHMCFGAKLKWIFFPSWVTWGRRYVIFYFCGISDNKGYHMRNWSDLTPMYRKDIHLMYTTVSGKRRRFSYVRFGSTVLGSTF